DVAVVEGVMGLHDGLDGCSDVGSTAEVAKWLQAPVLLVVDAWCLSRSAAAMVLGYTVFDPEVAVKGVVFNRVAGDSHAEWLQEAMRSTTAVSHLSVLGCLPKDANVHVTERHLGLHMPGEGDAPHLEALGTLVANNMDIDTLLCMAKESPPETFAPLHPERCLQPSREHPPVRIGIAKDEAFCFYYEDNLRLLEAAGAELVPFSPLTDPKLPEDLQALYFGGGYPELHGATLEGNTSFRASVHDFCKKGGLCWAECGGLMYLAQTMTVRGKDLPDAAGRQQFQMAGVLPFDVSMTNRMVMGYCTSRPAPAVAELLRLSKQVEFRCQQYHFSEVTLNGEPAELVDSDGRSMGLRGVGLAAYQTRMERPGAEFVPEGIFCHSTVASYCHVHFRASPGLAEALVAAARRCLTVVSLLPSGTEALCSIPGAAERLVAVSAHCDFPSEVLQLRKATRSLVQVDGRNSVDVEEQVQRLLAAGITDFHPIDVDWLRS
ncbi:cbiA, partial [Symbiodinium pilosum]